VSGDTGDARRILEAGFPAGAAFAAVTLLTYLPVYVLGLSAGTDAVGVFSLLAYFITFANLFYNSVQQSTLHKYVARYATGGAAAVTEYARRLAPPLFLAGLASGVFVYLFAGPILHGLYGPEFALSASDVLPIALTLVVLPGCYVAGPTLMTANRYGVQLGINVTSLAIAVTAALAMLPGFDVASAGQLLLIGTACRAVGGLLAAYWLVGRRRP
jgi:O-antigen/teichoic acid export membrane protein